MEVIISATALSDTFQLTDDHRFIYKLCIESIYDQLSSGLNLVNLSQVIIPEDYEKELFSFQQKNGQREFITKNEFGLGFAQVVTVTENDDTRHVIFLRKDLVAALLPDEQLEILQKSLSEENYEEALKARNLAINTIIHEFAHVDEMNKRELMGWIDTIKGVVSVDSKYFNDCFSIWTEYYACRKVSTSLQIKADLIVEMVETCKSVDSKIQEQREKYHMHQVSLDEFVIYFHEYTSFMLNKMASNHGHFFAIPSDSRIEIIEQVSELLIGQPAYLIWSELGIELDLLFQHFPKWESVESLNNFKEIIKRYYNGYDIFMSDTEMGVYYDIPVKFR